MFFEDVTNTECRNECIVCFPTCGHTCISVWRPPALRVAFCSHKEVLFIVRPCVRVSRLSTWKPSYFLFYVSLRNTVHLGGNGFASLTWWPSVLRHVARLWRRGSDSSPSLPRKLPEHYFQIVIKNIRLFSEVDRSYSLVLKLILTRRNSTNVGPVRFLYCVSN